MICLELVFLTFQDIFKNDNFYCVVECLAIFKLTGLYKNEGHIVYIKCCLHHFFFDNVFLNEENTNLCIVNIYINLINWSLYIKN